MDGWNFGKVWLHHPATQDGPVSIWRWLKYHLGDWMELRGRRLQMRALYPDEEDDGLPF